MRASAGWLLGTGSADVQHAECLFLNGRGPSSHHDLGVWIERRVADVVRERSPIVEYVRKLCSGKPSSVRLEVSLAFACFERCAFATGEGRATRACPTDCHSMP